MKQRDASGTLELSTDPARLDIDLLHDFLARESYWARGIPRATLERALAHSICISAWSGRAMVGFARVVTDQATFGYLADVFVVESQRGRGVARAMLVALLDDPRLQGLRRMLLVTRDAHRLYAGFGFRPLAEPARLMERHDPDAYSRPAS
jgi:N-acetylglutamate synthase-like GNAT family acetyltransferase